MSVSERAPGGLTLDPTVKTFDSEPGCFYYGYWRSVTIIVWADSATLDMLRRLAPLSALMQERAPKGRSNIQFVLHGAGAPDPATRAVFESYHTKPSGLCCQGVILEGDGFWASGLRAFVTNATARRTSPVALHQASSIEEMCDWVPEAHAAGTGEVFDREEWIRALWTARYHLAPPLLQPK